MPGGTSQSTFFEICRAVRLQSYLEAEIPLQNQKTIKQMRLLLTYLDQTCLDLATQYILPVDDPRLGAQALLDSAVIRPMPHLPAWIQPREPRPLYRGNSSPYKDARCNGEVAAFFFRAPYSEAIFRQAFVPPVVECTPPPGTRPPLWYEWRLDLLTPKGDTLREYGYCYDQRRGAWRLTADHICPWEACSHTRGQKAVSLVGACRLCEETMDYYTRWLAAVFRVLANTGSGRTGRSAAVRRPA